jgi:hypothetical protein
MQAKRSKKVLTAKGEWVNINFGCTNDFLSGFN